MIQVRLVRSTGHERVVDGLRRLLAVASVCDRAINGEVEDREARADTDSGEHAAGIENLS